MPLSEALESIRGFSFFFKKTLASTRKLNGSDAPAWEREKYPLTTWIVYKKGLKQGITSIQSFLIYNPCSYRF